MTAMLASVVSRAELHLARTAGADIIDLKDPTQGALGALNTAVVADLVAEMNGVLPISATVGDVRLDEPDAICERTTTMAACGVDYVKLGLFPGTQQRACIAALGQLSALQDKMVIVLFADQPIDDAMLSHIAASGCVGVMLDTAHKNGAGLRDCLSHTQLSEFVTRAHVLGLFAGLAGSLQQHDIKHLLSLAPDYLGFRGALCRAAVRTQAFDIAAAKAVRALIPNAYQRAASF